MIKRNKTILCFFLVLIVTLMSCCIVAATDNADHNTTTTTITKEVNKNVQNQNTYTNTETQSDDNTIEETNDQNAVKQNQTNAKAKINKVQNTKNVKTATDITGPTTITTSGEYVLNGNLDLGSTTTDRITISANNVQIDGRGYNITRNAAGSGILIKGNNTVLKNIIFNNMKSAVTVYCVNATNVTIDNCTFINCSKSNGIIEGRQFTTLIVKDTKFYGDVPAIYITPQPFDQSATASVSLCEIYINDTAITTTDFGSGTSKVIMTSTRAQSLFLYMNVEDLIAGENKNFKIHLGNQISGSNNNKFIPVSGTLNYTIYNSENPNLQTGTENADGELTFDYKFQNKGKYYIDYNFKGSSTYKAIGGTKTLIVREGSNLTSELVTYKDDKATLKLNLTNSTGSPIPNAPVTITVNGVDFTETTNENGIVTINIEGLTPNEINDIRIAYYGDETTFIASNITEHYLLDLTAPLLEDTTVETTQTLSGYTGSTVTITATVKDEDDNAPTVGRVIFKNGDTVLDTIDIENGVATYDYTIGTDDVVTITCLYNDTTGVYANSSSTTTVNRLTIPTNLTISDIPTQATVGETITFKVKLTNRTGDAVVGKTVVVYVKGSQVTGLDATDSNGEITVIYKVENRADIPINATFTTDNIYLSNTTGTSTISASSISLMEPVINVYRSGNASIGQDYVILVNVTVGDELVDSDTAGVLLDSNLIESPNATYDSQSKLWTITFNPDTVRVRNIEFDYNGVPDVINSATKLVDVNVNKLPSATFVDYAEYDEDNITLMVYFTDEEGNRIHEGIFHVNMNNSEAERQDYYINNIDDPSYKWKASYDAAEDVYLIYLDKKFYRENGQAYAFVTYNGSDFYDKSSSFISEMEVKTDINIRLNTYDDSAHTTRKDVFYIDEIVDIYLDLINHYGFMQNGRFNISIANNKDPESAFTVSNEHASNVHGYYRPYTNTTSGEYTITVNYAGSGAYNTATATKTFTLLKLESNTTARVINNTAGNVTLGVKVVGVNNQPIRTGKLTVEVNGVPKVLSYHLDDNEDEIIVNLNDLNLGISTTSEVPISITFQGTDRYSSSEAIDEATIGEGLTPAPLSSITADKGVNNITVSVMPEDEVKLNKTFNVYGYLKEVDGTPVSTSNLNITIINPDGTVKSSQNVTTLPNGYYTQDFTASFDDYEAGEYTVNVSYYDNDHNITSVTQTFTVTKATADIHAIVENTTAGNITVKVRVTDENSQPINEGKVNITDSTGNVLYDNVDVINGEAILVVDDITSTNPSGYDFVVNYYDSDKYAPVSTTEGVTGVSVTTRDLTINATLENSTYQNTTLKVNITDSTTGNPLPDKEFNVTLHGSTITTGKTGPDGTVTLILPDDVHVGSQTIRVIYTDDVNYTSKTETITANILARESKVNATIINTTAGNVTLRVNSSDATTGNPITQGRIIITDNGVEVANMYYGDATGIVDVTTNITDSGNHNLVVTFTDSYTHKDSTYTSEELADIIVDKRNATVSFNPINSTIGNTTVNVTVSDTDGTPVVNGMVNVYSDIEKTNLIGTAVTDENGTALIDINATPSTTKVYVEYTGNTTYNENVTEQSITLVKRISNVNASLVNTTAGSVTVRVNVTDATTGEALTEGIIVVKDEDGNIVAEVPVTGDTPGYVDVKTNITGSGDNKLTVEYKGTDVYSDATFEDSDNTLSFTVEKRNATVTYEVVNSTYNDTVVKVTVIDQDGSTPIVGGEINVFIDGVDTPVGTNTTNADGVAVIYLKDVPVTATNLVVNYTGNTTYNENVTTQSISITPRAVEVNATITNKTAGNVTVRVNVTDIDTGLPATSGIINITNNGETVATVDLASATFEDDGTIIVYTNVSETGRYKLTVDYNGTPYYGEEFYNIEAFNVEPKESNITATVPNTTKGNTTVNVTFVDPVTGEKLNGTVYISVNGSKPVPVEVKEGNSEIPLDLPIGESTILVTFDGDEKYNSTSYEFPVTVEPRSITMDYEITNHTQGNVTIEVTVNDTETGEGINGTIIVDVDGIPVEVEIVDGKGTAVLDIPITGGEITVSYPADDTYEEIPATSPEQVNVEPRESSITVEPGNTDAGNTSVIVTLKDPVTDEPITSGTIIVTDNGVEVARIEFNETTGVVEVPTNITTSGPHKLNITYLGNENYTESSYTDDTLSNINIANRTANITVTPNNSTFGNTTIDVSVVDSVTGDALPEGGIVEVYDGETLVGTGTIGSDGKVTVPIKVPVDTTSVTVKYLGNTTSYDPAVKEFKELSVEPRASNMVATVTNATAGNITVKVNLTDATTGERLTVGTVNITNKGEVVGTVDLSSAVLDEDGLVVISTNITNVGNYALVANYSGNENYTGATFNIESFDSTAKQSNITADIPNTTKDNTTIIIKLVDPVTGEGLNGTVYVIVDGQEPGRAVKLVDGVPEEDVKLDLPVGNSTVKVVFDGDKTYNTTEHEFNVTVEPRKINVNATLTNTTQGNITLEVNVTDSETGVGVNGTVNVTLPNGTDVPVEVVDGKAVVVLDIPITDNKDEPLTITFLDDGVHNQTVVNTTNKLTINKRESTVVAEVTNPVANKTEVTVTVSDPVTGNPVTSGIVSVKLDGEEIGSLPVGPDGTVIVPVDLATKGTYDLNVTFEGNENYTENSTKVENVKIQGSESEFNTELLNSTQGNVTVKVNLTDSVTGEELPLSAVNVTVPGKDEPIEIPVNPDGTITIPLDVGKEQEITISYPGDDTYNKTETIVKVDVEPRAMNIVANVTNNTAGNITVKVNVTDAVTGEPVRSGKVNITLGDEVVGEAIIENGIATVYTNITQTGTYTLTANVGGNENYTDDSKNVDKFNAIAKTAELTADLNNNTLGNTTLDVTFKDPVTDELLNGTVYVTVDGKQPAKAIEIVDGKPAEDQDVMLDIPYGHHEVEVVFYTDGKYNETHYTFTEDIDKRDVIVKAEFTNETVGNITIHVTANDSVTNVGVNGTVNVTLPDGTIVPVEIIDGEGYANLTIPVTGEDEHPVVNVTYVGDENYPDTKMEGDGLPITVEPRSSTVEAEVIDNTTGQVTVRVNVTDTTTGKPVTSGRIIIKDGTNVVYDEEFTSETGIVDAITNISTSGNHELNVTFTGNENYNDSSYTDDKLQNIGIENRTAEITVTTANNTFGNTSIVVNVTDSVTGEGLPAGGLVEVYVDGVEEPVGTGVLEEDGTVTVDLEVPVGTEELIVKYLGNESSYDPVNVTYTDIKVEPREAIVNAEVTNKTAGNVTVEINITDATNGTKLADGTVIIKDNHGNVVAEVDLSKIDELDNAVLTEDGTLIVYTNINETGSYKLSVDYDGSPNYGTNSDNTESFIAEAKESNITAHVDNTTKGNTTLNVTFVDPVTGTPLNGTVIVTVNGKDLPEPVVIENGTIKGEVLLDLPVGNNTVNVTFTGDEKYNKTTYGFKVEVEPRTAIITPEITNSTQGNVTLEITAVDSETGEGINGTVEVTLPDGTKVNVTVEDGYAKEVLDIPMKGEENQPIGIKYLEDDTYPEVDVTEPAVSVKVEQRNSTITAEPVGTSANGTSVKVTLRDPVTDEPITSGTIVVTDNGEEVARIDFDSETGEVIVPTNITTSGKHNLTVIFEGNENYTSSNYTDDTLSDIDIANRTANITVTPGNSTFGNTTIDVTVTDSQTGNPLPEGGKVVVYDKDGIEVGNGTIDENGKITVPVDVPVDTTELVVKYLGNDTSYDPVNVTYDGFTLEPRASNVDAKVTNETAGNITVKVNVTDATTGKPVTSGTVNITLNGKVVGTAIIPEDLDEDGTVTIYTNINETGNYKLVAKYSGDENYTGETYTTESFDATPKESNITADIPNHTKGNTTLDVTFVDPVTGTPLNGTVYVVINGEEPGKPYKVEDGELVDSGLLDLPVGNNTVKVVFDGDKTYNATEVEFNVTVEPRQINVNATLTNTTQGNITLEINVTDAETGVGVNGTVNVTLPNGTDVPVEVVDGKAVVVLDIPVTNNTDEPLKITYPADGENEETVVETTNPLTIDTRDSKVDAKVSKPVANKTEVSVEVTDPVTGDPVTSGMVSVYLNDTLIGNATVNPDGTVTVPVDLPEKGDYNLTVVYEGNENYTSQSFDIPTVTVEGSESEFDASIVNSTQGDVKVKVNLTDPVTGEDITPDNVNVTLPDGSVIEVPVDSDGTISLPDLPVGDNNITISYPGDDTYNATSIPLTIPVEPRSVEVTASVTNNTAGNTTVKVTVTDPVTGEPVTNGTVTVKANGEVVGELPVGSDGTVSIPTNITSTGTYPLEVTYGGNDDYAPESTMVNGVTVLPKESALTAQLTNNTRGNTSVSINLKDPVTGEGLDGTVTVTLPNGTNIPVPVKDGVAVVPVKDLPVGNNTLRVTYLGNDTYDSIHMDVPVSVQKRETSITPEVLNDTAGSVTVHASVKDTTTGTPLKTGKVLVKANGKIVGSAPLDENGEATITTDISKSGDYNITLEYEGDNDYASSTSDNSDVSVEPRASNVTATVADDNVGSTQVNITMVDPTTDTPLSGEVIITLPNGTNITTPVEDGNIIIPVDLPVGDNELTITYPGNETYDDIVVKLPVRVNKRQTSTTAKELTNNAGNVAVEVTVTDDATGEPIKDGEVTISVDGEEVGTAKVVNGTAIVDTNIAKAGNYNLDVKYTGSPEYETSQTSLNETVTPRKTNVDIKVLNNTVAQTTLEVTVTDQETGKPVAGENVTITLPDGTNKTVTTDENGKATVTSEVQSGDNTISVTVDGNDVYNASTTTLNTTVDKVNVRVIVDSVTGIVGETITLTAHVIDEYGNPVSGGNLVFKLNGRTLQTDGRFDTSTDKPMKLKVNNGIVTYTMTADLYLRAGKNITASYSGSYKYLSAKGNVAEANIQKRRAEVTVTTTPGLVQQDRDVVFTATIKDVTSGSTKSLVDSDNAYVIFKINGKTLKDSKGENIKVKVENGVAKYTYHVPLGTSGMIDGHLRDYMVTAVYACDNYYPDARDTVAYNVARSKTSINITSATVKDDKLSIKANILDQYGKNVIGTNKIAIKVNGKTFKVNGKQYTGTVKDGVINVEGLNLNGNKVKTLTIVTGERQSYYESQVTTKSVKTL